MSAETLRRAAALMRERAEANFVTPSPWGFAGVSGQGFAVHHGEHDTVALYANLPDANHIASWHPAVALAVADWLEATGRELDSLGNPDLSAHPQDGRRTAALAAAHAYLQETP